MDTQRTSRRRPHSRADVTRRRRAARRVRQQLVAAAAAGALLLAVGSVLVLDAATTTEGDDVRTASARVLSRQWFRQHLPSTRRSVVTLRPAPAATSTKPTSATVPAKSTTPPKSTGPTTSTAPATAASGPGLEPPGTTQTAGSTTTQPTVPTTAPTTAPATAPTTAPTTRPTSPGSATGNPGGTGSTTTPSGSTTAGEPTVPPATLPTPSAATNPTTGRRGLWNAIGRTPTDAELAAAPALYGVVVVNIWETAALRRLKQLDPSIVVLAYQDLSSARSYDNGPLPPAGVSWAEATATPGWLATDTAGRRIEWSGYPGHWQTAVWDTGYQAAWTANVTRKVVDGGFDGVLADNAVATLKWYSGATLAGTSSTAQTDAKLRSGIQALVDRAGPALRAKGKILVPNVSDARLYPGRWAAHARWGGAMEENFAHFGTATDLSSFVTDWGSDGWEGQAAQLAQPGLTLAITRAASGDQRALRYGYASLLVRGDGDSFWQPSADAGSYATQQWIPEQRWFTGPALEGATKVAGGAWTRTYDGVWAAVNPTTGTVTVTAPSGATDNSGKSVRTVQLAPASGVILRVP